MVVHRYFLTLQASAGSPPGVPSAKLVSLESAARRLPHCPCRPTVWTAFPAPRPFPASPGERRTERHYHRVELPRPPCPRRVARRRCRQIRRQMTHAHQPTPGALLLPAPPQEQALQGRCYAHRDHPLALIQRRAAAGATPPASCGASLPRVSCDRPCRACCVPFSRAQNRAVEWTRVLLLSPMPRSSLPPLVHGARACGCVHVSVLWRASMCGINRRERQQPATFACNSLPSAMAGPCTERAWHYFPLHCPRDARQRQRACWSPVRSG